MKLTTKIQKAINLASRLHVKQKRKADKKLPYISHPFAVAWILNQYTKDEDVIVAGLMHDVLEDVKNYRYGDLKKAFGARVAKLVKGVTEDKDPNIPTNEKADWEPRKKLYLKNLEKDSQEVLLICAADKIHNLRSMIDAYAVLKEKLWKYFNSPADKKIWFYEEVLKVLKRRLKNKKIVAELAAVLKEARRKMKI